MMEAGSVKKEKKKRDQGLNKLKTMKVSEFFHSRQHALFCLDIYIYFLCFSLIENIGRCETWCECFIVDHMMCQF